MAFGVPQAVSSDWRSALGWAAGTPLILAGLILGAATFSKAYARQVARVPDSLRFGQQPWVKQHKKQVGWTFYVLYILATILRPTGILGTLAFGIYSTAAFLLGLILLGWTVRTICGADATDACSRIYLAGLAGMGILVCLAAVALLELHQMR